VNKIKNYI